MKKVFKYYLVQLLCSICSLNGIAQVYHQDFGLGNNDPATIGTPLSQDKTEFSFNNSTCPPSGSYTIIRRMPILSCFNKEWIDLSHDNNTVIPFGMMMVVNNSSTITNKIVYRDTINLQLCPGAIYHCSVALINIDEDVVCPSGPDFPVFELRLEDGNGGLIKKDTTRPGLGFSSSLPFGYRFNKLGYDFIMPGGVNKMVVKLTLLHSVFLCAEDFAIDDVIIAPVGPAVAIGFAGEPSATIVKSVCFQNNATVVLSGNMESYYPNPAVQWQVSTDKGITWQDIPGATANTYSRSYPTPDTFYYRLTGSDISTIANPNCRVVSNIIRVEVNGLPKNYTISNNSPVCAGQDLKFTGEGAASYIWTGPNGFYDNIAYPHIFYSALKDSGMYYVKVFSLGGCSKTDSTYAVIIGTDVSASADTAICIGRYVRLQASKGATYLWTPSTGLSNTTIFNPLAKPKVTTNYIVTVADKYGCTDTAHVKITVRNKTEVKAAISANNFLCRNVDSILFVSTSKGDMANWNWDFGNGQTSIQKTPASQYYQIPLTRDFYLAKLIVTDTAGCTDVTTHSLTVVDNCYIAVPNAFTPNNDRLNDYLYPLNAYKASHLSFKVYNRLGQLVFFTNNWLQKWDGKFKGMNLETGVFVWILAYTDASGNPISLKGTSLLMR